MLGQDNANLPAIVDVLVQVLAAGDELVGAADGARAAELLRQMQVALPAEVFAGFVMRLKPKQQAALQAVLAGQAAA